MMRVLFDQGTPVPLREFLKDHSVRTAWAQGWDTLSNGELLRAAEDAGFDVLVTTDQNLPFQLNLTGRTIAIVVLGSGQWPLIKPLVPQVVASIFAARPGTFIVVEVPGR
jgi:hypothetical protein